jgi:hypothetical protein
VEFPISELQPSDAFAAKKKQAHGIQRRCTLKTELPWLTRYRLALLLFGTVAGMLTGSNMNILAIEIYLRIFSNIQQKYKLLWAFSG